MKGKVNLIIAIILGLVLTTALFLILGVSFKKSKILTPLAISQIAKSNNSGFATKTDDRQVNILLLGLDARRGDRNPRCDAIHMISLLGSKKLIKIITVPRGTEVPIPAKKNEYTYLSNACHSLGIDYAVSQIQKITGVKNDYLIKLGFSQTLGILRLLNLPSSPLLKYLRNRSLPLGDYQRSHNQAIFIKDLILNHFDKLSSLPKSLLYLLYKLVDTDMDFETAYGLYTSLVPSQIHKDPSNIILITKPPYRGKVREMHVSLEDEKDNWREDSEFKAYQKNMEEYLDLRIKREDFNLIKIPFEQRIWEQIESTKRYKYHYELLNIYVMTSPEKEDLPSLVLDFIAEMEALQQSEWKKKGEELLLTL